ncbi:MULTISPECIES: hypothetical protein [Rhizobium]|uniref:Uncharacterized protein n=3 Tax=Rhizobium/Agrobacterium group TaxID=227290 RepID=A0A6P1CEA8_RHITR|nr:MULTISPECIES: hypothetical protein [Rhizobium]MBB4244856.1 hypothetical protein [Rhizobium tropici]MBB5596243.1 hypothetical protein [Rhizobium tropici]MBB6305681.1 hypothetical protein [Rhizobium leucaenae]MBB6488221.1 hypothetical protein [Rhizobium lusitanum]MBB6495180.1 hypothetical protein [Rhizobium tropici]
MLRSAALGEVLPLKARSGLMLFLRRGMWGWARALPAAASPDQDPFYLSLATRPARDDLSAVVHVLATIAMSIHQRRAP